MQIFEEVERTTIELEMIFVQSFYGWMTAFTGHFFPNILKVLGCCNFT